MRVLLSLSLLPLLATAAPSLMLEKTTETRPPTLASHALEKLPNSYIVVFKDHVDEKIAADHHSWIQEIHNQVEIERTELKKRSQLPILNKGFNGLKHTYNIAGNFMGYSGHFDEKIIDEVRRHPDVEYVEADSVVRALDMTTSNIEKQAPWGLARISHREHLNFRTFNKYVYATEAGAGVDVYVIDTGINTEHVDFEGRASWGKTIPYDDLDEDLNGHGTHCSGTIAGKKYGVAKSANVIAVKVLGSNGSGTMSDVVKGVEWATLSHLDNVKNKKKGFKGSVANMSLGGGKSAALDRAVNGAVTSGVHFAVAAGNDNEDSCKYSPAAAELAITVGASALDDSRAFFSNYGKCNDIFAPGLSILSTWIGSQHAVNTISGTSMASPHIAGLLAYYLSLQPEIDSEYGSAIMTPKKMKETIIAIGTKNAMSDLPDNTPNVLAWNGGGKSNFSSIVDLDTSYDDTLNSQPLSTVDLLRDAMENDFEAIAGTIAHGAEALLSNAETIASKVITSIEQDLGAPCHDFEIYHESDFIS